MCGFLQTARSTPWGESAAGSEGQVPVHKQAPEPRSRGRGDPERGPCVCKPDVWRWSLGVGFSVSDVWFEAQDMPRAHSESLLRSRPRLPWGAGKHRRLAKPTAGRYKPDSTHNVPKTRGQGRTRASIRTRLGNAGAQAAVLHGGSPQTRRHGSGRNTYAGAREEAVSGHFHGQLPFGNRVSGLSRKQ